MMLVPPQIVPFEFGTEPINSGDTIAINCVITRGDFPINITWSLNNKPIREDDGISINNRKKISALTIDSAEAIHRGEYSCAASNEAGSTSYSAFLAINGSKNLTYLSSNFYFWYHLFSQ